MAEIMEKAASTQKTEKNFEYYLIFLPSFKETDATHPQKELKTAFLDGYQAALRKTRTYSRGLFLKGYALLEETRTTYDAIRESLHEMDAALCQRVQMILPANSGDFRNWVSVEDLTNGFLDGYKFGIHVTGKYDECLFLTGEQLADTVLVDLEAFEGKRTRERFGTQRKAHSLRIGYLKQ